MTPKVGFLKEKSDQNENACHVKVLVKRMKRQVIEWKKIFTRHF
jgi:hypothetical protein